MLDCFWLIIVAFYSSRRCWIPLQSPTRRSQHGSAVLRGVKRLDLRHLWRFSVRNTLTIHPDTPNRALAVRKDSSTDFDRAARSVSISRTAYAASRRHSSCPAMERRRVRYALTRITEQPLNRVSCSYSR